MASYSRTSRRTLAMHQSFNLALTRSDFLDLTHKGLAGRSVTCKLRAALRNAPEPGGSNPLWLSPAGSAVREPWDGSSRLSGRRRPLLTRAMAALDVSQLSVVVVSMAERLAFAPTAAKGQQRKAWRGTPRVGSIPRAGHAIEVAVHSGFDVASLLTLRASSSAHRNRRQTFEAAPTCRLCQAAVYSSVCSSVLPSARLLSFSSIYMLVRHSVPLVETCPSLSLSSPSR